MRLGDLQLVQQRRIRRKQEHRVPIGRDAEVRFQRPAGVGHVVAGSKDDEVFSGTERNLREHPLGGVLGVVGERIAGETDRRAGTVVNFDPVVVLLIGVHEHALVAVAYLADHQLSGAVGERRLIFGRAGAGVRIAGGGACGLLPCARAVRHAGHGLVRLLPGVFVIVEDAPVRRGEHHGLLIGGQAERRLDLRVGGAFAPGAVDQQRRIGADDRPLGQHIFERLRRVVRYAVAGEIDVVAVGVIQLDPVAIAAVGAEQRGCVGRHEFVKIDADTLRIGGGKGRQKGCHALVRIRIAGARAHLDPVAAVVAAERIPGGHRFERQAVHNGAALARENQVVVGRQLERGMQAPAIRVARTEHDEIAVRLDGRAGRERPLGRHHLVVGQAVPPDLQRLVGIVIQLHPIREIACFIRHGTLVARHDLVDPDGLRRQASRRTALGQVQDQRHEQKNRQRHDQYQSPAFQSLALLSPRARGADSRFRRIPMEKRRPDAGRPFRRPRIGNGGSRRLP